MTQKKQLAKILEQYNYSQSTPDDVLFKLISTYGLHKTLVKGTPYSKDSGEVCKTYVINCTDIAIDIYRRLGFGPELLVVYEDCYSEKNQEEIRFVESCLNGTGRTEIYSFSWKFLPMKQANPTALANNHDIHTCTRRLYEAKKIDIWRLFKEIILSDIGGQYNLASKIFIVNISTACMFHLYDDRGLWVSVPDVIGNIGK